MGPVVMLPPRGLQREAKRQSCSARALPPCAPPLGTCPTAQCNPPAYKTLQNQEPVPERWLCSLFPPRCDHRLRPLSHLGPGTSALLQERKQHSLAKIPRALEWLRPA